MKLKLLKSFNTGNPYESDTPAWHCFIDVSVCAGTAEAGSEVLVEDMIKYHGMNQAYYENYLSILEADGLIQLSKRGA